MAAMLAGFSVIMTALAFGLWSYARNAADTSFDLLLDGAAIAILDSVTATPSGIQIDIPNSALEILALVEDDRVFYQVSTADGTVLTGDANLPAPPGQTPRATPRVPERQFFDAPHTGEAVRFVRRQQVLTGMAGLEEVAVQVGQTRGARDAMQRDLFIKGIAVLSVLALIGLVFVQFAIFLAMRPLAGIEADIQEPRPRQTLPPCAPYPLPRARICGP